MNPSFQVEKLITRRIQALDTRFFLSGIYLEASELADCSGLLPILFEQQQKLMEMIGLREDFQPGAYGHITLNEDALFGKTLEIYSSEAVVPLCQFLADAASMMPHLAVDKKVDLTQFIRTANHPVFLSVILDNLYEQSIEPQDSLTEKTIQDALYYQEP